MENSMKHYKDPATNDIYAYAADGSDDAYIKGGLVPISDEELAELRKPKLITEEQLKQNRSAEIQSRLSGIDTESARPMRAKLAGNATSDDDSKLAALDAEAAYLRKELAGL